ncbi:WD40 repeat-like protein [Suillus decipiens]|nr:WD40 repeat-like protein [Suillus decipiens]
MDRYTLTSKRIPPRQTLRGHTSRVRCVVHLPGGHRIITSSSDSSLRLWDLKDSAQIGDSWRDEGDNAGMYTIALSPDGSTVASGSDDGKVRLWDIKTGKVITKWTGHTKDVWSVCWNANGERVLSGSADGTAGVWHVKSGKTVLSINTQHQWVGSVMYSPDSKRIATGGYNDTGVKLWDSKTGKLISIHSHTWPVHCLTWTSDGKKIISASYDLIIVFDTTTLQHITTLRGHNHLIRSITLSPDNRLLASASWDKTACLWNLDTNFSLVPLIPLIQHGSFVECAAFSADGKLLITSCEDSNVYVRDIQEILKLAGNSLSDTNDGLKMEASSNGAPGTEHALYPSQDLDDKSFLDVDATRGVDELPPTFFDGMQPDVHSLKGDAHPRSSARAFLSHLSLFLSRSLPGSDEATKPAQPSRPSRLHLHMIIARLSSLIHRSSPDDAENEVQQLPMPSRLRFHALLDCLSSLLRRSRLDNDPATEPQPPTPSGLRPDIHIGHLFSLFRSLPATSEEIEPPIYPRQTTSSYHSPHVVNVAAIRDKQALYVAPRPKRDRSRTQPAGTTMQSRPLSLWAHLVLFLCCASPQQAEQTQQQLHGEVRAQASSHSQPATTSTSTTRTPTTLDTSTTSPGATTTQSRRVPLRVRLVLFLCCASSPHDDSH